MRWARIAAAIFVMYSGGRALAEYYNYNVHNVVSDNGALSGFSSVALPDNNITPAKLRFMAGVADNSTYYRGDGVWSNVSIVTGLMPSAGVVRSDGSAWLTSYSTTGTGNVVLSDSPVFTTGINVGQGVNVLYPMDQAVRTSDSPTFAGITIPDNTLNGMKLLAGSVDGTHLATNIVLATTGTISGAVMILDNVAAPTVAQMYGSLNLVNATGTYTLPTAALGMSGCVMDTGTAHDVLIAVPGTDYFVLVGVTGTIGKGIKNSTGSSVGDFVCFIAGATNKWYVLGKQGTWTAE